MGSSAIVDGHAPHASDWGDDYGESSWQAGWMLLSSELIGYPAGARVLIVNCDDFGMSDGVNAGVVRAVEEGIATSCSLMVTGAAAPGALQMLRERPQLPFGVHLTLVEDAPLSDRARIPTLLGNDGRFRGQDGIPALLAEARIEEVEIEFRAQIDAAVELGPTHLDWHCLADGGRDDIFDLTLALADEYGLAIRAWRERSSRIARRRNRPAVDHPFLDSFTTDQNAYAEMLRTLPVGLSEWAVHPSADDEPVRRTDLEFLVSPEARETVRSEGIILIDYRYAPPA